MLAAELLRHGHPPAAAEPQPGSALSLRATAERRGAELQLSYQLSGPLETLRIPPPEPHPQRRDGLWRHTCLEAFLALAGQEGYWELNLAPSGHWNLYRLDGYRHNLRPDPTLQALALDGERSACQLQLRARLPLPAALAEALAEGRELELALTAVLEHGDGSLSYWALAHPPGDPDFHWRGGWRRCR
ncbi:MAG: DOMON-like domain-containing protein [Prochlorococcaceae cyanobacterium]